MNFFTDGLRFGCGVSAAALIVSLAGPAAAQMTPEEVWTRWVDLTERQGATVTEGGRSDAAGKLELSDVVISVTEGTDPDAVYEITFPSIVMEQTGDGKVRMDASDANGTLVIPEAEAEGGKVEIDFSLRQTGDELLVGGTPEATTYEYKASELVISLDDTRSNDPEAAPLTGSFTFSDVVSNSEVNSADLIRTRHDSTAANLAVDLGMDAPDGGFSASGTMADLALSGESATPDMPAGASVIQLDELLTQGLSFSGQMSAGATEYVFEAQEAAQEPGMEGSTVNGSSSMAGLELSGSMSSEGITYAGTSRDARTEMTMPELPAPLSYAAALATADVAIPVQQTPEGQTAPYKISYQIDGLTLGDGVWNLFDPGTMLPRDPGQIVVDISGTVRLLKGLFDPTFIEPVADEPTATDPNAPVLVPEGGTPATPDAGDGMAQGTDPIAPAEPEIPIDVRSVTINNLLLDAVGAKVSATGELNAPEGGTLETPVGQINGQIDGANKLMDTLVEMGLVPQDQVMSFRMMLAMFAQSSGEDQMTTDIEFREGGQIFANGQQLK